MRVRYLNVVLALLCSYSSAFAESPRGIALKDRDLFQIQYYGKTYTCGKVKNSWIPGKLTGKLFLSADKEIKSFNKALKKTKNAAEKKKINKKLKASLSYKSKGTVACNDESDEKQQPPAGGSPTPTPTPTPTKTQNSGNPYYDVVGNLTSAGKAAFGVPSSMSAGVNQGIATWNRKCASCHGSGANVIRPNTFSAIAVRITQEPMFFMIPEEVTEQDIANVVAYRNF